MKSWYSITNKNDSCVNISLHDEIGMWGITAKDFINDLRNQSDAKSINLSIHSPGGGLLDGLAIYNALIRHPAKVFGHVEGIAASAASFILMASDQITMPENAFIMIHNAQGGAIGDAEELRDTADMMDKLQNTITDIYEKRTGLDRSEIVEMMNDETWMDSSEALEKGFADTITDSVDVAAKANVFNKYFKSMPIENNDHVDNIETIKDFERFLRDAGDISRATATKLASRAKVIFQSESDELPEQDYSGVSAALMRLNIPKSLTSN